MTDQLETQTESQPKTTARFGIMHILFTLFFIIILSGTTWAIYQLEMQLQKEQKSIEKIEKTQQTLSLEPLQQQLAELKTALDSQKDTLTQHDKQIQNATAKTAQPETEERIAEANHLIHLIEMQQTVHAPQKQINVLLERLKTLFQNQTDPMSSEFIKLIADSQAKQADVDVSELFSELTLLEKSLTELDLRLLLTPTTSSSTSEHSDQKNASWWKIGLEKSWQVLQRVVVIQKTDHVEKPLILPEEKELLMQNIRANINFSKWGLLHQQTEIYTTSLTEIMQWVNIYFDLSKEKTQAALKQLQALKDKNIIPSTIDTSTLKNKLNDYQQNSSTQQPLDNNRS